MAERAGYDPADAVADATGVRNRRDYSISAIAPRNLAERTRSDRAWAVNPLRFRRSLFANSSTSP